MSLVLEGFRALVGQKIGDVKAVGTKAGFELYAGGKALHTEAGAMRTFKSLNTLVRLAKAEGVNSMHLDLTVIPKAKKSVKSAKTQEAPAAKPKRPSKQSQTA